MEKKIVPIDWIEPAHDSRIRYKEYVTIASLIKEKYQVQIDKAFDEVARKIGFVVRTTIPVVVDVNAKGAIQSVSVGSEDLRGTLFESEVVDSLNGLQGRNISVTPGQYMLYILWFDALRLKLKKDWMEPAHLSIANSKLIDGLQAVKYNQVIPGIREPVHWFDSRVALQSEDAMLISVLDEVYPELNLAARVSAIREQGRVIVQQNAVEQITSNISGQVKENPTELLRAIKTLLEKY